MTRIRESVSRLTAYTPGEQPRRPGLIKLNTNENPYPPSPRVGEVLAGLDVNVLRPYPDPVQTELRACIAGLHGCRPEQVFVGNGSDEVLALCATAFVEDDGAIAYFEPSYSLYPVLADIRDVRKVPVELGADFEWRPPDPRGASLFYLPNPNAPTSIRFAHDVVEAFCGQFEGVVLVDEAYVDFADRDCMDLALRLDNVIVARTLSKSYSLAGLRLGYAVGPEPLIQALFKVKDSYNVSRLSQELALAALRDSEWMRANVAKVRATRERLAAALRDLGFRVWPSQTNFLWVEPPDGRAVEIFDGLRERDILIRYFPGPRTGHCVRITIGTDAEADALIQAAKDLAT